MASNKCLFFVSRVRKWGPSAHDSSELQLNRTHKCTLSSCAALCSSLPSLLIAVDLKDLWYLHSFVSNAVWILPNPKQDVWFLLPRVRAIWKIYLYFPMNNFFIKKKKQLYSPLWSAGAFQNIYFMLNRVTHRFLHFIISTRSHLIFIFLEKILASSRRELKTQHWLIYQDNSSSAVSQCHNDLYAQDFCYIVDSDL